MIRKKIDYKEYARQMRENCPRDYAGNIVCTSELWEELASMIENCGCNREQDEGEAVTFKWVRASMGPPAEEPFVFAIVSGWPKWYVKWNNAPCVATYNRAHDQWEIAEYPKWKNPKVKYWAYIPDMPKRSGDT